MVVIIVVEHGTDKGPFVADGFGEVEVLGVTLALEHEVAKLRQYADILGGDNAFGGGARELGEEAADLRGGGIAVGPSEFAGEIGGPHATVCGVGV